MRMIEVGQKIEQFINKNEGTRFDVDNSGAIISICFRKPTKNEIQAVKSGAMDIGMFVKEDVIFMLVKFEGMEWMDAPYHVALSKNLTKLDNIEEKQGFGCLIVLIDTENGEVKALRYVGLGTNFSRKLKINIENQMQSKTDMYNYNAKVDSIMKDYSVEEMVSLAKDTYRIG